MAVIHNGIVENFQQLRADLEKRGHTFASETDTECIAHLIEERRANGAGLADAVRAAVRELDGAYALVVSARRRARTLIVGVKVASPLVVGIGEGETILASDIPAVLGRTNTVIPLDEGQVVEITPRRRGVHRLRGRAARRRSPSRSTGTSRRAQKGGYDSFMRKEIDEQPAAIRDTLVGRADADGARTSTSSTSPTTSCARSSKVFVVACGTAFHSGLVAKYAIEHWTRLPVEIEIASEFRYRDPVLGPTR